MKHTIKKTAAIAGALVAGTLCGGALAASAIRGQNVPVIGDGHPKFDYPVNANGDRYGSLKDAPTLEEAPDLIAAVGSDGKEGFIKKADFFEPMPASPAEAVATSRRPGRTIPLYSADGETVTGKYVVRATDLSTTRDK